VQQDFRDSVLEVEAGTVDTAFTLLLVDGQPNKFMAANYKTVLLDVELLQKKLGNQG
jgi:hypothetical protein